jgi:Uma2 family endonuclease
MATPVSETLPQIDIPASIPRRRFTVAEYERMIEIGMFKKEERIELVLGAIVQLEPKSPRHAAHTMRLNRTLHRLIHEAALIGVHTQIILNDDSEPEPDLVLLRPRPDFYGTARPMPADILLLVEIADTSYDYDRNLKIPLYARAGIRESWLINLPQHTIQQFTDPANGRYQKVRITHKGDSLTLKALPNLTLPVDQILL